LRSEIATSAARVLDSSTIAIRTLGTDLRGEISRVGSVRLTTPGINPGVGILNPIGGGPG
jgi:hypothetical protein